MILNYEEIKVGKKVFLNGKETGEIVESPTEGRFMIKRYDSEWNVDLYLFCSIHEGDIEIK